MHKHTTEENVTSPRGLTRRDFIKTSTAVAMAAGASWSLFGQAPALAQDRELHILEWSSFVKPADVETDRTSSACSPTGRICTPKD
jgi:anaerobic selenocysteine-containing dehydrogenase